MTTTEDQQDEPGPLDPAAVAAFLSSNPSFLEGWIKQNPEQGERISHLVGSPQPQNGESDLPPSPSPFRQQQQQRGSRLLPQPRSPLPSASAEPTGDYTAAEEASIRSVVPRAARKSVTNDLFHQWLAAPRMGTAAKDTGNNGSSGGTIEDISGRRDASDGADDIDEDAEDGGHRGGGGGGGGGDTSRSVHFSFKASSTETLEQSGRLLEPIHDIFTNELNFEDLCHKTLLNVRSLTGADKCTLFLARGPKGNRYLETKLVVVGDRDGKKETRM